MTNKYKKEIEEINKRVYNEKSLAELKRIGKKKGLLNVDQYKKANKKDLVERLVKGRQLSDNNKDVLLEIAQTKKDLKVNSSVIMRVLAHFPKSQISHVPIFPSVSNFPAPAIFTSISYITPSLFPTLTPSKGIPHFRN